MADHEEDDGIPLLDDVVRAGRDAAVQRAADNGTLSETEIEAIAARVVERHTREMEQAVARAIRMVLYGKSRAAANHDPERSGDE